MRMFCLSAADCTTETIWSDLLPCLEHFERVTGEISADQVRDGAISEAMQVWGLQDAECVRLVAVTEIAKTPGGLICTVRMASGSAPRAYQERLLDEIGWWARSLGCRCVRLVGRKGWLRRFPRLKQVGVVMEWAL